MVFTRTFLVSLLLTTGPARAEDPESPFVPDTPTEIPSGEQPTVDSPAAGPPPVNPEVAERLERIEQTLRTLEQSLQGTTPERPAGEPSPPAPTADLPPPTAAESVSPTTPEDTDSPPASRGFRLGAWFITVLEALFGLGIALMSVALGLVLGRRKPEARLTLKIAVNGQRRETATGMGMPGETLAFVAPTAPGDASASPVPSPPPFRDAADYGLVDLKSTDFQPEGRFSRADAENLPAETLPDTAPLDDATEKTIDEILRELTGQSDSSPGLDPLAVLEQASGDYSRIPTIERAMQPAATAGQSAPATPAFDSDYADITDMDEIETRLDLARAYVEMGDLDAARELLQGVQHQGTRAQQTEARRWLQRCQIPAS